MTEKMRESLSALMDNEANEMELQRVLKQVGDDEELRQTWVRYHAARTVMTGQGVHGMELDISGRVRDAIREEARPGLRERVLRPMASFAVAASVRVPTIHLDDLTDRAVCAEQERLGRLLVPPEQPEPIADDHVELGQVLVVAQDRQVLAPVVAGEGDPHRAARHLRRCEWTHCVGVRAHRARADRGSWPPRHRAAP